MEYKIHEISSFAINGCLSPNRKGKYPGKLKSVLPIPVQYGCQF